MRCCALFRGLKLLEIQQPWILIESVLLILCYPITLYNEKISRSYGIRYNEVLRSTCICFYSISL